MYRLVEIYGPMEPWWNIEDWEMDVRSSVEFTSLEDAKKELAQLKLEYADLYPESREESEYLIAFWSKTDYSWCEDCGEYQQNFHSLALLEDGSQMSENGEVVGLSPFL